MKIEHTFVDYIPDVLEENRLYVSVQFGTVAHLCACGCGKEVITPLGPAEWKIVYDGASVSLIPSVGNWGLPCRSHYWIDSDRVRWARQYSDEEIERVRMENMARRRRYFEARFGASLAGVAEGKKQPFLLRRLWRRLRSVANSDTN